MTGYQLHDAESEEILGSVLIIQPTDSKIPKNNPELELAEGWEAFNKLEETEGDHTNIDEFVVWFNDQHVTQIERLYLDYIQP